VADLPISGLPTLVIKRDGQLVPFEADKISQSLYAATEEQGQASAFLARELTDGVLHFLAVEFIEGPPTTAQIADLVVKVVRELGQPRLANAYAERQRHDRQETSGASPTEKPAKPVGLFSYSTEDAPETVVKNCLRSYSLQAVFARDLAAAHEENLLALGGLEQPEELARNVVDPREETNEWWQLLHTPARILIFDSPEFALSEKTARGWLRGLATFCDSTDREAILNLNVATPPPWADRGVSGPLFNNLETLPPPDQTIFVADLLCDEFQKLGKTPVRVDWHLKELDFAPENLPRLNKLARLSVERGAVAFTLDRLKRPIALGPGVNRTIGSVLMDVGLNLPHFLNMVGVNRDARLFIEKLPSLSRMAIRAGIQKRNFLRSLVGRPILARGFLVDRARLLVVPVGLNQVVEQLLGQGMEGSKLSFDFGRQIVETLQNSLHYEGLATNLEIAVDGPKGEFVAFSGPLDSKKLQAAGILHGIAGFGTVPFSDLTTEELIPLLQFGLKKNEVVRLECQTIPF